MKEVKTIAVLSDTHGNLRDIEKIMPILSGCDLVVHLGDRFTDMDPFKNALGEKLKCVKGNCDYSSGERELVFGIGGVRILFVHGDAFGVKGGVGRLVAYAKEIGANAVFYGHTHAAEIEEREGITLVNPGNITRYSTDKSFAFATVAGGRLLCKINRAAFDGE